MLDAVNGRYCGKLAQVGSPFFHTTISFVLPKKSNLTNAFSKETLKLREEAKLVTGPNFADKLKCPNVTDPTLVGPNFHFQGLSLIRTQKLELTLFPFRILVVAAATIRPGIS